MGVLPPREPSKMPKKSKKGTGLEPVERDYTIRLGKAVHGMQFKRRAPRALREIRKFAAKAMHTRDVRIDVTLNQHVWSKGIRAVPRRVRVRLSRKRNEDEDAKESMYTTVTLVPNFDQSDRTAFRTLGTAVPDDADEE